MHSHDTSVTWGLVTRQCGLHCRQGHLEFNRIGAPAWFLNGKILRRDTFGLFQIWMLDLLTPLFRRIDWLLPFPGLSLVAAGTSKHPSGGHTRSTRQPRSRQIILTVLDLDPIPTDES